MFIKAGAISLALLLLSRVLGLLRETALAAALGNSAQADIVLLMLTLPDWLAGVLAGGGLGYVLLPAWAGMSDAQQRQVLRTLSRVMVWGGLSLSLVMWLAQDVWVRALLPGLADEHGLQARAGVMWAAWAVPLALLAALGVTRLQHLQDVVGMYGANVVVNAGLIAALVALSWMAPAALLHGVGGALLAVGALRLAWLALRLRRDPALHVAAAPQPVALPAGSLWWWAALSAGLPLALPFAARSWASAGGAGDLATFNYAWKLVELPQLLAIQLVATLALPALSRAQAAGHSVVAPLRQALSLAWVLACAAAAALVLAAPAWADLLFGWGRMGPQAAQRIGEWGRIGALGLLPQAVVAVGVACLAAQQRLGPVAVAYAVALMGLAAVHAGWGGDGVTMMWALNAALAGVAAHVLVLLWPTLAWRGRWWVPLVCLLGAVVLSNTPLWQLSSQNEVVACAASAFFALLLVVISAVADTDVRASLRFHTHD